jgi:hypothetical protein
MTEKSFRMDTSYSLLPYRKMQVEGFCNSVALLEWLSDRKSLIQR